MAFQVVETTPLSALYKNDLAEADAFDFANSNGFTWGGMFYVENASASINYFTFIRSAESPLEQCGILYGLTTDKVQFFSNYNNGSAYVTNSLLDLSNGWNHIIYRMGAGARTAGDPTVWDVFLNGVKTTIDASFNGGMLTTTLHATENRMGLMGGGSSTCTNSTGGRIDESYFFDKALTDDQCYFLQKYSASFLLGSSDQPTHLWLCTNREPLEDGSGIWRFTDVVRGVELTDSDASDGDPHAPGAGLIYPVSPFYPKSASGAGPAPSPISGIVQRERDIQIVA